MPKATLEFNLPEDQDEFKNACQAAQMSYEIHEFLQWIRQKRKYAEKNAGLWDEISNEAWNHFSDFAE